MIPRTHPINVVSTVPLLSGSLRIHLEVHELNLTHMFARIIIEIEIYHQVGPAGWRRFTEAIFDAAHGHFVGVVDVVCDG